MGRKATPSTGCRRVVGGICVGGLCETAPVTAEPSDPATGGESWAVSLLERLTTDRGREDRLTHLEQLPPRAAEHADWPAWTPPSVRAAYAGRGVVRPWRHQVAAAEAAWAGEHVVLSTGTASGKSLAFQLPALAAAMGTRGRRGQRGAGVLYLAPTKALAHDQWAGLRSLDLDVRISTHDGDSTREERDWTRDHAEYVLTNPDMLHRSLLPSHEHWSRFFGALRFVVVDEAHHYRGVFGAHVSQVLRRLRRVCARYGAEPTFVLASATMAEPELTAGRLTGLPVTAVTEDSSPRGRVALALWEPPLTSFEGENGAPVRRAASSEAADLLTDLVIADVRTLAFVRSRRGVEQVARTTAELLGEVDPSLATRVAAYRGGYLPEERRELEGQLRRGDLIGLAATNALELGIDISGLDAVLMVGFPGTRAALWQQLGRAGRGAGDALGVLVARDDPLDTYLVHHPEALLGRPVEASVFDPDNPHVLGPHLCAAAQELPLTEADLPMFGPTSRAVLDRLTEVGLLRRRPRGWFWTDRRPASELADIRSAGGAAVQLLEAVDRAGGRHRRRRSCPRHRPPGRGLPPPRRDLAGARARPRRPGGHPRARRPGLVDLRARDHLDLGARRAFPRRVGRLPALPRRRRGHPPGGVVPEAPSPRGRGDRRGAARPPGADAADGRRVVDGARPRRRGVRSRARRRPGCGARCRALLDRAAPAGRHLRPVGHRRRLHRPPPRHGRAHRLRLRRAPRGRRLLPSAASTPPPTGCAPPGPPSTTASAPTAAPRACSPPSAATRTTRSTRPAPSSCSTRCSATPLPDPSRPAACA